MPAKNTIKIYIENGHYHVYNRGVEKRDIFLDEQDYKVFLHFLKRYLTAPPESPDRIQPGWKFDLFDKLNLIAYCLMPNHFHLLIKQLTKEAMAEFIRALSNSYIRYFNEKYERIGPLFQGTYKAVLVETEPYLLHLTRYIHLNPIELEPGEVKPGTRFNLGEILERYSYSSYGEYLGKRKTVWIHSEEILAFFKTAQKTTLKDILSYQSFVEDYKEDSKEILGPLTID
ncbi:MAG: transposase [Patescibacteria group bacterium]